MPTTSLPPTPRDFDIHRMSLVLNISTYRIADKHGISQTRVRQIIQHVSNWLAETLPVPLEAEQDRQTNLAKHLAAEQMRRQIEQLQHLWDTTNEPKYSRQLTRVISALARLGVIPGQLESLTADSTIGPYDPSEPQTPWSEDNPWANQKSRSTTPQPAPTPSSFSIHSSSFPPPPPSEDCSPKTNPSPNAPRAPQSPPAASHSPSTPSLDDLVPVSTQLHGLDILERQLLGAINTAFTAERIADLEETLRETRDHRLRIYRQHPHLAPNTQPAPQPRAGEPATTIVQLSPSNSSPGSALVTHEPEGSPSFSSTTVDASPSAVV